MNPISTAVFLLPSRECGSPGPDGCRPGRLLGITLLERAVLAAAQAGVKEFVLLGEPGRGWEEKAARFGRDRRITGRGLRLEFAPLPRLAEFGRPGAIGQAFWLIGADAVFSPEALVRAAAAERGRGESLHLVDNSAPGPGRAGDIGLKVLETPAKAAAFVSLPAEGATSYAGVSLCPPESFPALCAALAARGAVRPDADFLNGVFVPSASRLFALDGLFCRRVSDRASFRSAYKYVLGTARKPTDSYISRHFNRYISLFLTRIFLRLGMPPNPLSVVCILIGLSGGWFVGQGGYVPTAIGALLFEFASVFDGCDGEISRLTYRSTKLGGFLDMIGDASTYVIFFISLPVGLYRHSHNVVWICLGLALFLAMAGYYIQLSRYMAKTSLGNNVIGVVKDIERSAGQPGFRGRIDSIAAKIGFIYRRDFFATAVCLVILAGGAGVLMALLVIFVIIEDLYLFFFSRRRLRALRQQG